MSVYNDEFQSRTQRTTILSVALACVTTLQAVTMFFSLHELIDGGGAESIAIPAAAAVVIGVAFWIAWHWISRVGPLAHNPVTRTLYCALAGLLTMVAIGTTSWFVASAIGGTGALRAHMHEHVNKANVQLNQLTTQATKEQAIVGTVSEIEAAYRGYAESESRGNLGPNGKGCGKDCEAYQRGAANYRALQASVNARFDDYKLAKSKAEKMLADMTKLASMDASVAGQAKFAALAAQLGQQYAAMDAISALTLVNQVGVVEFDTKNGDLRVKSEALSKRLHDEAKKLQAEREPLVPLSYTVLTRANATWEHADKAVTAWIVGVSFDVLPLILFLALMLAYSEARTPYQPLPAFIRVGGRELDTPGPRVVKAAE